MAHDEDVSYITARTDAERAAALDASIHRLAALKRRERLGRRLGIVAGLLSMIVGFVICPALGVAGAGMIFVPVGGFIMFWSIIREIMGRLSHQ